MRRSPPLGHGRAQVTLQQLVQRGFLSDRTGRDSPEARLFPTLPPFTPTSLLMRLSRPPAQPVPLTAVFLLPPGHLPSLPAGSSASILRICYQRRAFSFCFRCLRPFPWCPLLVAAGTVTGQQAGRGESPVHWLPGTAPPPQVLLSCSAQVAVGASCPGAQCFSSKGTGCVEERPDGSHSAARDVLSGMQPRCLITSSSVSSAVRHELLVSRLNE